MFGAEHDWVDISLSLGTALLVFIPAIIVAIHQTRQVGRKVDDAAEKADTAVKQAEVVAERTDTGNGRTLGETVHDTDQTVELLAAMMHTNTKEVVGLSNKLDAHIEESEVILAESKETHEKIFETLAESKQTHEKIFETLEELKNKASERRKSDVPPELHEG